MRETLEWKEYLNKKSYIKLERKKKNLEVGQKFIVVNENDALICFVWNVATAINKIPLF